MTIYIVLSRLMGKPDDNAKEHCVCENVSAFRDYKDAEDFVENALKLAYKGESRVLKNLTKEQVEEIKSTEYITPLLCDEILYFSEVVEKSAMSAMTFRTLRVIIKTKMI